MRPPYRHTETGWVMLCIMGAAFLVTLAVAFVMRAASGAAYAFAFPPLFLLVLLNFYSLTVTVDDERVSVSLGAGLIRRRLPLASIASARLERNSWYGGWGLRWTGKGWFWTVGSLDAVAFSLKDGREFFVGSDEADKLLAAVRERLRP